MNFFDALKKVGHEVKVVSHAIEKPALEIVETALPIVMPATLPFSLPVSRAISSLFKTSIEGDSMNPLESFAITMILGIVQTTVKNPAHKAALQSQLVGIADMIFTEYGMALPANPTPASGN